MFSYFMLRRSCDEIFKYLLIKEFWNDLEVAIELTSTPCYDKDDPENEF